MNHADSNLLGELHGRNSLPAVRQKIYRDEPLPQWNFAFAEYRLRLHGDVLLASSTAILVAIAKTVDFSESAKWAVVAIAKADFLEVLAAHVFGFIPAQKLRDANCCRFLFHGRHTLTRDLSGHTNL
jgi:hypothetical protein